MQHNENPEWFYQEDSPDFSLKDFPAEVNLPAVTSISQSLEPAHDLSHEGLASKLGNDWFHRNVRYVHKWGAWFIWDGNRWVSDESLKHLSIIGRFLKNEADKLTNSRVSDTEIKLLKSSPFRINIEAIIKSDQICSVSSEIFDSDIYSIGMPQGTLLLKTGEVIEPDRKLHITKSTGVTLDKKEPVLWLSFLDKVFGGDKALIQFMQRLCGYALTGLTTEERVFFFYGTGANGKSKCLETIYYILGDYAKRAPSSLFLESRTEQHPTNMAGLHGARLVLGSELPAGKTWNEETLKDLTGGDTITARKMRQDFFEFKPQFTLLIAGNHQPRLKNVDESIVRRITLIPFSVTIPVEERDKSLGDKLKAESGAILNWCAQGAVDYFNNGLGIPKSILDASQTYIENEDITGEFLNLHLSKSPNSKVLFSDVYASYQAWMKEGGNRFVKRDSEFRKELADKGFVIYRSNSMYRIRDYQLKTNLNSSYLKSKYDEF